MSNNLQTWARYIRCTRLLSHEDSATFSGVNCSAHSKLPKRHNQTIANAIQSNGIAAEVSEEEKRASTCAVTDGELSQFFFVLTPHKLRPSKQWVFMGI